MSEVLKDSKEYLEQGKVALLITVGEENVPYVRSIGAYANDGFNIYFLTQKATEKVKHIKLNPAVTFYIENEGQPISAFKSLALTGEAHEIQGEEFDKAVEGISVRYPKIKDSVADGNIKASAIYKIETKFIKWADYTKSPKEAIEYV